MTQIKIFGLTSSEVTVNKRKCFKTRKGADLVMTGYFARRLAICSFVLFVKLVAQTTTGSILGTVTDPSGAIVANATVTVTNVDTNIATKVTNDSTGNYVATTLAIGHYSVAVEAPGFKKSVESGITVNVQDRVRVDMTLQVGQIVDTVEVQGGA